MAYGTVSAEQLTTSTGYTLGAGNSTAFKNRIINGAMAINQRALGTFTPTTGAGVNYTIDRWTNEISQSSKFTVQQSSSAPPGFQNSYLVTSSSAYTPVSNDYFTVEQRIEGYNMADLAWGTASAKTVTLSFWVQSSLTGTFGGAIGNSAGNYTYAFTYSIPVANTWTQISVTVPGATSGTWLVNNGIFCYVYFSMGAAGAQIISPGSWLASGGITATGSTNVVATSGATWYMTGAQLEVGTQATSFDYRAYGHELMLCQRYYQNLYYENIVCCRPQSAGTGASQCNATFLVQTRAAATVSFPQYGYSPSGLGSPTAVYNGSYPSEATNSVRIYSSSNASQNDTANFSCQMTVSAEL